MREMVESYGKGSQFFYQGSVEYGDVIDRKLLVELTYVVFKCSVSVSTEQMYQFIQVSN